MFRALRARIVQLLLPELNMECTGYENHRAGTDFGTGYGSFSEYDPILFTVLVSPRMSNVCSNILSGSRIGSFWLCSSSIVLSLLGSSFDSCSVTFIGFTSGFPVIGL